MPPPSASPHEAPLRIELELVRAEAADDAFAFRFARQTYLIRGRQGAYETAELPWSRELLRDLEELRRPDRDPATVARMGDMLRELLGAAGWAGHEAAIVDARAARRRVHLTIRSAAAELYALPWELLTLRADGQHLGALGHVLLRYAWPGTSTVTERSPPAAGPGRVLLAWSAAGGGVPAAEQTAAIEAAARASGRDDAIEVLPHASYGAIADALDAALAAGRPFAALHLLCHGAEVGSTFGLGLDAEGGEGRPAVVDAGRLQQLLAPYADGLRLVVVSACDGGNMGEPGNRIGSVAQRLHRAGLQYVIASRYPLSAKGSTRMAGALYQSLLAGEAVEQAFVEARTAASREVSQLDWASLQLYARPEDGDAGCVLAVAAPVVDSEAVTAVEPVPEIPPPSVVSTPTPTAERPPAPPRRSWVLPAVLGAAAVVGLAVFLVSRDDGARDATVLASAPAEPTPAPERAPVPAPAPDPAPVPELGTGPEPTSTSDTGSESASTSTTTSTTEPTVSPERTPKPPKQPKPPAAAQPAPQCSSAIQEQLRDRLGSPDSGVYKVKVRARADGKLSIVECTECGTQADRASQRAAGAKIRTYTAEDVLPCKTTVTWQ